MRWLKTRLGPLLCTEQEPRFEGKMQELRTRKINACNAFRSTKWNSRIQGSVSLSRDKSMSTSQTRRTTTCVAHVQKVHGRKEGRIDEVWKLGRVRISQPSQDSERQGLNGDPFLASLPLLLLIAVVSRPLPLLYGVKLNGKLQIYSKPAMRWQERRPTSLRTEQEPRFEDKMQELQMHVLDWRQRACRREAGIWAGVKQELTRVMLQPFKSTKCNSSA
ncbi:hypothetical protein DFH06DRAFT_1137414 [Mycena polygramma]|nr:hypothetical protein DFH06DRAFT_1137414 [Mycena polygramma]